MRETVEKLYLLASKYNIQDPVHQALMEGAKLIEEQAGVIETANLVSQESTSIIQKQRKEIDTLNELLFNEKDKVRRLLEALRKCGNITSDLPGTVKKLEAVVEELENE